MPESTPTGHAQPLLVETDPTLGGRWTSLRSGEREWLWANPHAESVNDRPNVEASSAFVDAGGGEECFPCLRGPFDHGLVWNRPWQELGAGWQGCTAEGYRLARRMTHRDGAVVVDYRADADAPRNVLHATHLLLELSDDAVLEPADRGDLIFWDPRPDAEIESFGGEDAYVRALGQGEQSAVCYSITDCTHLTVRDGADALHFELSSSQKELPLGFAIWRNLKGWPPDQPYRSLGIEPGIGRDVELRDQATSSTVETGPDRPVEWTLTITATQDH